MRMTRDLTQASASWFKPAPKSLVLYRFMKNAYMYTLYRLSTFCWFSLWSVILVTLLAGSPAYAHHPMGGTTPSTWIEGLLSGLGHPMIGLDHFTFIVAIGFISAAVGHLVRLPLVFITATVMGTLLHLASVDLFFVEAIVAGSVLVAGSLLIYRVFLPMFGWFGLVIVSGIVHGYAYGEAIIGAQPPSVLAYLIGFALIQFSISVGVTFLLSRLTRDRATQTSPIAGGVMTGIGFAFLYTQIMPF